MKTTALALSLLLSSGFAAARGGGGGRSGARASGRSSGGGFSAQGHFSRPLSRPSVARSSSSGSTSRTGFVSRSTGSRSSFGGARKLTGAGTGTPGGGTTGGSTGSGGTSAPAVVTEQGGWATPGSKILTAGQQPVYSTPSGGGQFSVDGGGFVAINQGQAQDVGRGPGVTWASQPDKLPSSGSGGISGSGASANGPTFNPAF
jgi:hypothetical protein